MTKKTGAMKKHTATAAITIQGTNKPTIQNGIARTKRLSMSIVKILSLRDMKLPISTLWPDFMSKAKGSFPPEQLSGLVRKTEKQPQAVVNSTLVPIEKDARLPVVIEGTFADKWIKPLKEHCQKDLDRNGRPKRTVTAVKADQQSVIVDVIPSEAYAAENPQDGGARYSFEKTDNRGSVKVDMGSKDGNPLNYEYFRMMMEANRKNGIKVIAFKDIQTDEFRDKLLAAALEFDMKVKDAPEKVNVNAPYLKTLPNKVKIKLGIYNGDITPAKSAEQIKENIQRKQRPEQEKEPKEHGKPMLALPAHIPTREMD